MNVFTFSGNLGNDCRTNTVGGSSVVNFSVAVTEGYGDKKKTHWIDCAYWGKGGEAVAPYLKKGQQVVVSGEVGFKEATDKYKAAITCRVNLLTLAGKRDATAAPAQAAAPSPAATFDDGADIPF
jgi:single stranded DNA-binding protein